MSQITPTPPTYLLRTPQPNTDGGWLKCDIHFRETPKLRQAIVTEEPATEN